MPPPTPGAAETAAVPDAAFAPERATALHEAFEGAEPTDQVDLADHGFEPHEIAALTRAGLAFPDGAMVRGQWEAWEQERDMRAPTAGQETTDDRSGWLDCWECPRGKAIRRFGEKKINELADRAIADLRKINAAGTYGDDYRHKTLWDEYCHEIQNGPTDMLERGWDDAVGSIREALIESIPSHEAVLLTIAAAWYMDAEDEVGGAGDCPAHTDLIGRYLQREMAEKASHVDLSRFDPTLDAEPVPAEDSWELNEADFNLLAGLSDSLMGLAGLAEDGLALIALGEAVKAIDDIKEGIPVDINVSLAVGRRKEGEQRPERQVVGLRVNAEEIVLDEESTTHSSDGSTHRLSRVYEILGPEGDFSKGAVRRWLDLLAQAKSRDGAQLTFTRDRR